MLDMNVLGNKSNAYISFI